MTINTLDGINFKLNEYHDFSWLRKYGTAFSVIDETGSGCICIGLEKENKRVFCKIAGANTVCAEVSPEQSIRLLKNAVEVYRELQHPNLIKLKDHYDYDRFYVAVFEFENGDCLFDHWNFDKYFRDPSIISPKDRFFTLPIEKKLKSTDVLFSFLSSAAEKNYIAVDFYDSSIMYDFDTDKTVICDVDLFLKRPVTNTMGEKWWGTKRLKAPEEYVLGADIDEQTNVFTLGAMLFDFFGNFSEQDIEKRYQENRFIPCPIENWQLDAAKYSAARKAVNPDKRNRYKTISEFWNAWKDSVFMD